MRIISIELHNFTDNKKEVTLPLESKVVNISIVDNIIVLTLICDDEEQRTETRTFSVIDGAFYDCIINDRHKYIDSFVKNSYGSEFLYHVFEITN